MSNRAPLRALHCRSSAGRHGPERALLELAPALAAQGVIAEFVALYRQQPGGPAEHPWVADAVAAGITAHQIPDRSVLSVHAVRRLTWRIHRGNADVLHTHDYKTNMLGGLVARRGDQAVPWVATVHLHTTTSRRLRLYRAVDLFLLRLADRVVAVSREQRRLLLRRGVDRRRIVLVPNVIDARAFASLAGDRQDTRSRLGLGPTDPVVLFVGRLSPQKGVDVLLRAAPTVGAIVPGTRFLIAGNGASRADLEARAAAMGISSAVDFLGYRDDVASLLAASDVVAMPSRAEGLPIALLEAMAMGRPVVATEVGGIPDVITDRRHGLLVPPGEPGPLAEALAGLLSDPAGAADLGAAARRHVELECSPARAARRLAGMYRVVVAERRRAVV